MLVPDRAHAVVVVAGLPGAGKTTLVLREANVLDSDRVRETWRPLMAGLPYRLWRPAAHAWHWISIWRALGRPGGVIVVRPFTHRGLRCAVLRRARRFGRPVHLVVVDATPEEARAGQRTRGRTLGPRAMRRHVRRWSAARLDDEGWTSVTVIPRRRVPAPPPAGRPAPVPA